MIYKNIINVLFQRALLHGMKEEALLELPSGYKNTEITEEQLKKRQQRAKKRREQAHEKREKDKVYITGPTISGSTV